MLLVSGISKWLTRVDTEPRFPRNLKAFRGRFRAHFRRGHRGSGASWANPPCNDGLSQEGRDCGEPVCWCRGRSLGQFHAVEHRGFSLHKNVTPATNSLPERVPIACHLGSRIAGSTYSHVHYLAQIQSGLPRWQSSLIAHKLLKFDPSFFTLFLRFLLTPVSDIRRSPPAVLTCLCNAQVGPVARWWRHGTTRRTDRKDATRGHVGGKSVTFQRCEEHSRIAV